MVVERCVFHRIGRTSILARPYLEADFGEILHVRTAIYLRRRTGCSFGQEESHRPAPILRKRPISLPIGDDRLPQGRQRNARREPTISGAESDVRNLLQRPDVLEDGDEAHGVPLPAGHHPIEFGNLARKRGQIGKAEFEFQGHRAANA